MERSEEKIREEAQARIGFRKHLYTYLAVNALAWAVWFFIRGRHGYYDGLWPLYSTLGWGFGVLMHYFGVYHKSETAIEKEMKKIKKERGLD